MGNVYPSLESMIGHTPLMALNRIMAKENLCATVLAKLEYMNPAGSVKDRAAHQMIITAEEQGLLPPGGTIIEPTSGNTGVGLALVSAVKGYHMILVMPDNMSAERIRLAKAYGAEVVLTPGADGMKGCIAKAEELHRTTPNSFIPQQFDNPANPAAHEQTTGPEIWADMDGKVDAFVAGIGTGGTITGVARYLKTKNSGVKIVGVEPDTSPLLTKGVAGPHKLQGIGANFVPSILDRTLLDEVVCVSAEDAGSTARALGAREGILCGITSGAALWAALELAKRPDFVNKNIVALLPDTGERYLSTWLFA